MKVRIDVMITVTQYIEAKLVIGFLVTMRSTKNENEMLIKMPCLAVYKRAFSVAMLFQASLV